MTDRELLEMAAKAAGVSVVRGYFGCGECWLTEKAGFGLTPWNPLTDDGDALRLAVKLSMVINNRHRKALVEDMEGKQFWEDHEGDELAATRRAIVRAAAAIGSAM